MTKEAVNLSHAYKAIAAFFKRYENLSDPGYMLKIRHTYHVAANARRIAEALNLSETDVKLAELIGLLHDVGRFEELMITKEFNSARFDHALYGVQMLFEREMIREFIDTDAYDEIIYHAVINHSRLHIDKCPDELSLLHAEIIRDADKLDNFRVKIEEPVENIFPGRITTKESVENSKISERVYNALMNRQCVNVKDRQTPLDYFVTIVGFYFDLNFEVTKRIVHEEHLLERMTGRFEYKNETSHAQIQTILDLCSI